MTDIGLVRSERGSILEIAKRHGMQNVRVFGSVARGESTALSDLDLLVDVLPGRSLFDLIAFWQELEERLGHRVDVVTDGGLSPYLRERVYRDAVPL